MDPREVVEFDSIELFTALVDLIQVKGTEEPSQKREDALICKEGGKFNLKTGKIEKIQLD